MYVEQSKIESVTKISDNIFLIKVLSSSIASIAKPGQFCNIKVSENYFPLLRRPFSICDVEGDYLFFLFDLHGEGTKLISEKKPGESLELFGPLGNGFNYKEGFDTAVIVAGGLGVAPFPFLMRNISADKKIISLIGGRSKKNIVTYGLKNFFVATDDGSEGFHGTVVELLKREIKIISDDSLRLFGCGPTPMLKALQKYCIENNYDCQISVECAMACGFGICQGCPIDPVNGDSYLLVCKDGPVFEAKSIKF